ncbi:MAG: hypothetical protein ACXACH_00870 [Candidatus Hermodarchaeia archaeon]|jgi:hypothetical protein
MASIPSLSVKAVLSSPDLMTIDNISALAKGHGGLNIAAMVASNAIAIELLAGRDIQLRPVNQPEIEADIVIRKGVEAAKLAGAIPANAALLAASLVYLAGCNARVGCPGGNRKLGASARMIAGADKGGVILIPAGKSTNKITAFPAVHAIHHAMMEGKLTKVEGAKLPGGVGGPFYGHGALGEDFVFPELTENITRIGIEAMMNAYSGMGMRSNPFMSSIIATAAAMELIHPDAEFDVEQDGVWSRTETSLMAGRVAVKTVGYPDKIHLRGTNEEFDTTRLIADLGMMFKDIGTPTVVGIIAFQEIFACFKESAILGTGGSGGPRCGPQVHQGVADCAVILRVLAQTKTAEEGILAVKKNKATFIDPEMAMVAANTIARKADQVLSGPITTALIQATEEETRKAVTSRADEAFKRLTAGESLAEVVKYFEDIRVRNVEEGTAKFFGQRMGKKIKISLKKIQGGARRPDDFSRKYYGFDIDADIEITVNGKKVLVEGLSHKVIPDAVLNKKKEFLEVLPIASATIHELMVSPHTIINITVPVAVASAMKKATPTDAAREAEEAAYITASIKGAKSRAKKVGELSLKLIK